MSWNGNTLSLAHFAETDTPLELTPDQREGHVYVCGQPGMGKSRLLQHMILQDIEQWRDNRCGVVVIDPHGSLVEAVVNELAEQGIHRPVVVIDLADPEHVVGYNPLRQRDGGDPLVSITAFIKAIGFVFNTRSATETPLFAKVAQSLFFLLYQNQRTLVEAALLLQKREAWAALATAVTDTYTRRELESMAAMTAARFEDHVGSTTSRLRPLLNSLQLRAMLGQSERCLDLQGVINGDAILLVSLATKGGHVDDEQARLFGTLLLTDLWTSVRQRGKPADIRAIRPCYLYVDELQMALTPSIADGLAQARGFGLHCTLSNQYPEQVLQSGDVGKEILAALYGLTRTKIVFRTTQGKDLERLADELFRGSFDPSRVKDEIFQTKILGQSEHTREKISVTESHQTQFSRGTSQQQGESQSESSGETLRKNLRALGLDDLASEQHTVGSGMSSGSAESSSESESEGRAVTRSIEHYLVNHFGKELSSRTFYSIDEQRWLATQAIQALGKRFALALVDGYPKPICLQTIAVPDESANPARLKRYQQQLRDASPCSQPMDAAVAQVKAAEEKLLELLERSVNPEEPSTAWRDLKHPAPQDVADVKTAKVHRRPRR